MGGTPSGAVAREGAGVSKKSNAEKQARREATKTNRPPRRRFSRPKLRGLPKKQDILHALAWMVAQHCPETEALDAVCDSGFISANAEAIRFLVQFGVMRAIYDAGAGTRAIRAEFVVRGDVESSACKALGKGLA